MELKFFKFSPYQQFAGILSIFILTQNNRSWIANQEISPVQDGKFQMKVVVSNLFEIFHWVMSIGSEAKVIEPVELIEMVRGEAMKILDGYNSRGR